MDKGMRLMLDPRSQRALSMENFPIHQGILKLPRSFFCCGTLFCKIELQISFKAIVSPFRIFRFF